MGLCGTGFPLGCGHVAGTDDWFFARAAGHGGGRGGECVAGSAEHAVGVDRGAVAQMDFWRGERGLGGDRGVGGIDGAFGGDGFFGDVVGREEIGGDVEGNSRGVGGRGGGIFLWLAGDCVRAVSRGDAVRDGGRQRLAQGGEGGGGGVDWVVYRDVGEVRLRGGDDGIVRDERARADGARRGGGGGGLDGEFVGVSGGFSRSDGHGF